MLSDSSKKNWLCFDAREIRQGLWCRKFDFKCKWLRSLLMARNGNKNNSNGTPSCVILNDATGSTRIDAKAPTTSIKILIEGIQF